MHFDGAELDVMVAGDTHAEWLEYREGVVLVNSGSPNLPHNKETRLGTVGLLELERGRLRAEIVALGETDGRPNPGSPQHVEIEAGRLIGSSYNGDHSAEPPRAALRG